MAKVKRWLAGLLAAVLAAALFPAALAAEEPRVLTRGEACALLVAAADDYNPGVTDADVLRSSGGGLALDRPVTRAEALVMLSRAFGPLPAPVGDSARWAYPAAQFTDVPGWALAELDNIFQAGIVAGASATTFSPEEPVTDQQLDLFIRRVYALMGSNLKDDFYAAVNKQWLESAQPPAGYPYSGALEELSYQVGQQVSGLVQEIVSGETQPGAPEEKIKNLYQNILDWDARNAAGTEPLRPYLEAIGQAGTLAELMEVHHRVSEELTSSLLVGFGLTVDFRDSSRYLLTFSSLYPTLGKDEYAGETPITEAFRQYLTTLLLLGGESEEAAAAHAQAYYELERDLAAAMMDRQDYGDVEKTSNLYTMEELQALMPGVDLERVCAVSGFSRPQEVVVDDVPLLEAGAAYLTQEHLEVLKTAMKVGLLSSLGSALSRDFSDAANAFQSVRYGADLSLPDEETAAQLVQSLLSDYLGEVYVARYFSQEAKAGVEAMIEQFRAIYQARILALDWMSGATKAKAVEKLDAMAVNVGYPDQWDTYLDDAELLSAAQGGSYLTNLLSISRAARKEANALQSRPVDKTAWQMSPYTVNAYYDPTANSINFPAGILQAPFYDVTADETENLGGIGYVIAHEMTHAFDNNGAKYDSQGNAADWWTAEDYAAFQTLCSRAVDFYDGVESAPGIACNGTLTLSENIADLGALACITQAEGREDTPDYATLYQTAARTWAFTGSRSVRAYLAQMDVHAPSKLRGSRALQSCDEFYTAFDIRPGDGMWLDPEDRVRIW